MSDLLPRQAKNAKKYELTCLQCGKLKSVARPDAKYCSEKCRKEAERKSKELPRRTAKIIAAIKQLESDFAAKDWEGYNTALAEIEREIRESRTRSEG
jgi:hypothetical protein